MPTGDLKIFQISGFDKESPLSVNQAVRDLCKFYHEAIDWYMHEKQKKARASKTLRLASLVLAIAGGAVPLVAPLAPGLNSSFGYLLLALAGGLQLVDRFFGYSNTWSRYVSTALHLNSQLLLLQLDSARLKAVGADEIAQWDMVDRYARELAAAVESETTQWVTDFSEILREARLKADVSPPKK